jgi:hypothetical protein
MGIPSCNGSRLRQRLWDSLCTLGIVALLILCWGSVYWLALIRQLTRGY